MATRARDVFLSSSYENDCLVYVDAPADAVAFARVAQKVLAVDLFLPQAEFERCVRRQRAERRTIILT
jgi:hypothetical protein